MLKKLAFSLILAVFALGTAFALPKNLKELPAPKKSSFWNFLNITPKSETTIILAGDVMLGRSVMQVSFKESDTSYPFKNVAAILRKSDIVFANLETPIVEACPASDSGMIFCADPKMLSGLIDANINLVNLANNHTKNYGEGGLTQTKNHLAKEGIDYVGVENLVIKQIKGTRFGFLGFNFVDKKPTDSEYKLIADSKKMVDVLIVMVHWGNEYTPDPTTSQKEIADNLIKNGADVIAGGHPHWVQGIDTIAGRPIFYSLGNFIFDQAWSEETKRGLAVRLTYRNDRLSKIEKMPIYMENFAQPKFLSD